jgi:DNA adenine methylase
MMSPAERRRDRIAEQRELSEVAATACAVRGQHETADAPPPRVHHKTAAPIIKRAGGKTKLLPHVLAALPPRCERYLEPFLGGGAVFFAYGPNAGSRIVTDADPHLVDTYYTIREYPDHVAGTTAAHVSADCADFYYRKRQEYNDLVGIARTSLLTCAEIDLAALYLYLNRTCYSGLWRVNKDGKFNVPWGKYKRPSCPSLADFRAVAAALNATELLHYDFGYVLAQAQVGDVIYCDPPYPGTFEAYTADGFDEAAHVRLADAVGYASARQATTVVSIADCPLSRRLYSRPGWEVREVESSYAIRQEAGAKKRQQELLVVVRPELRSAPKKSPKKRK